MISNDFSLSCSYSSAMRGNIRLQQGNDFNVDNIWIYYNNSEYIHSPFTYTSFRLTFTASQWEKMSPQWPDRLVWVFSEIFIFTQFSRMIKWCRGGNQLSNSSAGENTWLMRRSQRRMTRLVWVSQITPTQIIILKSCSEQKGISLHARHEAQ